MSQEDTFDHGVPSFIEKGMKMTHEESFKIIAEGNKVAEATIASAIEADKNQDTSVQEHPEVNQIEEAH